MNSNARIPDNCVLCDKVVIESYWFPIESLRCCHQQYCAECLGLVAWCPKCHQFLGPKRKNGASRESFAKPIPSLPVVEVLKKSTPNAEVNNFHEDFHDDEDCVIIEDESEGNSNKSPKKRKMEVNNNDDCILIEDDLDEVIPPVPQPRKSILKNSKCATSLQQSSHKKRRIDVDNNNDIIIIDDEPDERIPPVTKPQKRSILKKSRRVYFSSNSSVYVFLKETDKPMRPLPTDR
ncbi:Oidioi.mRNA.OKI2018_I69.XSR.g16624.t1.cds [Oikopleura dioica]|uniref:Oidioi.mRNA.OKI2018_I69.XSR.g16624.t1.cds n=1 Tax=Oikopleura dioica TaxID=34765 RepID=A0ABN7SLJ3_OIKDI|nr:Oidioi.mRNA.OKI2018_I69.XSR.g16624.t1.cds [Oikopleura dioica]